MEIVHIVRQYSPSVGGLEDAVKNLCANLAKRDGVKVRIVTLNRLFTNPSVTLPRHEVLDGIPVTRIGYFGSKRYPLAFGILKEIASADIVHVHAIDFFYDFLALTKFLHRKTLVVSTHGGFFHTEFAARLKKIYFRTVTRFSALFYRAICASSENDAATFRQIAPASKVAVIENGVNVEKWAGRGSIVPLHSMIFVGRWSVNKAVPVLIDLVATLKRQGDLWNLILVGIPGEETRESLEAHARKAGVETQVQIHEKPSEEQIAQLIGQASFIASASRYEGFGISAVEGLSAGLVPLLSPIPPFEKLRTALGKGAVIDEKDLSQSAHRVTAAYNALVASPTPTREACMKFTQQYNWSGVTDRFMDIYRRVQ